MEGGDRQVSSWLKEEGFSTSLRTVMQVGLCPCRAPLVVINCVCCADICLPASSQL